MTNYGRKVHIIYTWKAVDKIKSLQLYICICIFVYSTVSRVYCFTSQSIHNFKWRLRKYLVQKFHYHNSNYQFINAFALYVFFINWLFKKERKEEMKGFLFISWKKALWGKRRRQEEGRRLPPYISLVHASWARHSALLVTLPPKIGARPAFL